MIDLFNLLWNVRQEQRINEVDGRAISGFYAGKNAELSAEEVKLQYDRMVLIVSAFGELLIEKGVFSESELSNKIIEIDGYDGVLDGRKILKIIPCTKCGSGISRKFKKCLICGTEAPHITELDAL